MSDVAKGLWALLLLIALILAAFFALPLLAHLLVELPQWGWGLVG